MKTRTRREFLSQVSQGMLVAAVGLQTSLDLNLAPAFAADSADVPERLNFGRMEPLVALLQETTPDRIADLVIRQMKSGTSLREIVAAAALANARTFGGEDYIGFHTMMALGPSYEMSKSLPASMRALPVIKVLHRNSRRIQEHGGVASEVLKRLPTPTDAASAANAAALSDAINRKDLEAAENIFAVMSRNSVDHAYNELLFAVQDESEVHRIVMPYRARDLVEIVGTEYAHTLLRQSVRYCVKSESPQYSDHCKGGRDVLPILMEKYRLLQQPGQDRLADDGFVLSLAETIFKSAPADAAGAVAEALSQGYGYTSIGEAISLAANQLVLRDAGRPKEQVFSPEKPIGSIHGDSIGVHASDSANAWRNMARLGNARNRIACLILGAHQVAFDRINRGGQFLEWAAYPTEDDLQKVQGSTPEALLSELGTAIQHNDQRQACATTAKYLTVANDPFPVFGLLMEYAISEDGALHAEKYYRTAAEDFALTRPSLRNRHLLGLARVTASAFGFPAPGMAEAKLALASNG